MFTSKWVCALLLSTTILRAVTITVDCNSPIAELSPDMYGIFFEDINHSVDGGLYAEMIKNRDFENGRLPEGSLYKDGFAVTPKGFKMVFDPCSGLSGWSLKTHGNVIATMTIDDSVPLTLANPKSMKLEIKAVQAGFAAVNNEGFWGISIKKGAAYKVSLYARSNDYKGKLSVALEDANGMVLAHSKIDRINERWAKYDTVLRSDAQCSKAKFVIRANSPGTIWFDMVSMFPENTFRNRKNGLREDLAQKLVGLKPSFMRFPGGCLVEGITLSNRYQWKNTIGPVESRPGHYNLWGYHATDGLGFHEYLQLCEDLNCAAMYPCNVGMSCQGRMPEYADANGIHYLQEALDAIEYAIGPVSSPYGRMRAENGHPEPFNLKYIEIGNENSGPVYVQRYRLFYHEIKSRYPGLKLIADYAVPAEAVDISDEHFYESPEYFIGNATRYDKYDRKGPKIYVGEFAANIGTGKGNLRAAIAEAAFMTGMERNADMVIMASYAPLFVNENDRTWMVDLVTFNGSSSYGIPSYYVHQLFSNNRPSTVVSTKVSDALKAYKIDKGRIAIGTINTKASFEDISVSQMQKNLSGERFMDIANWYPAGGWTQTGSVLTQNNPNGEFQTMRGDVNWHNCVIKMKVRAEAATGGIFVQFLARDNESFVKWVIGSANGVGSSLKQHYYCWKVIDLGSYPDFKVEPGRWYDLNISTENDRILCYLDGQKMYDVPQPVMQVDSVYATAGITSDGREIIVKAVNTANEAVTAKIDCKGTEIQAKAEVFTLSGRPEDENSFETPEKVTPIRTEISYAGRQFNYEFKPCSSTIFRLKVK